jgi:hypothetical protein
MSGVGKDVKRVGIIGKEKRNRKERRMMVEDQVGVEREEESERSWGEIITLPLLRHSLGYPVP